LKVKGYLNDGKTLNLLGFSYGAHLALEATHVLKEEKGYVANHLFLCSSWPDQVSRSPPWAI
jgi:surfactin synthase thioesterase subunit